MISRAEGKECEEQKGDGEGAGAADRPARTLDRSSRGGFMKCRTRAAGEGAQTGSRTGSQAGAKPTLAVQAFTFLILLLPSAEHWDLLRE